MTPDEAHRIAVSALGYVAADAVLLPRFLALTGIQLAFIRQAAAEPGFLAGVLHFLAAHEPSLLEFCAATGTQPGSVLQAIRALPQGDDSYDRQT